MEKESKVNTEEMNNEATVEETTESELEPIKIIDEEELNEATRQIEEYKLMAQRIQAEFENYRKRNAEAVRVSRNDGINEVIVALMPIADSFDRCMKSITDENVKNGVELIYKQVFSLFAKYEVVEIEALGQEFDPEVHNAIARCDDEQNANKVVEVFQKGYKRKDRVLRPAMVKVAQ